MTGKALQDYLWAKHTQKQFYERVLEVVKATVDPYAKHIDDVILYPEQAEVYKDDGDMVLLPRFELEKIEW